jgi:hypothetical protein
MESKKKIEILNEIKKDFLEQFNKICKYHDIDEIETFRSVESINNMIAWITGFYEQDMKNNNAGKKAIVLEMANVFSDVKTPFSTGGMFHESSIEYLFFTTLTTQMPQHIQEKAYLHTQVSVCDGEFLLDFALMEHRGKESGAEGIPIIGIECDGYTYHYETPDVATKTIERIRYIQMKENIKVFQYTGKEIYKDCTKLAKDFWDYVVEKFYPIPKEE